MLVLTHDAAAVIRTLVERSDVPPEGGLRITAQPIGEERATLELEVVEEPDTLDEVVEQEGANVFLEPLVAEALADKVLDAAVVEGGVRFELHEQDEGPIQSPNGNGPA